MFVSLGDILLDACWTLTRGSSAAHSINGYIPAPGPSQSSIAPGLIDWYRRSLGLQNTNWVHRMLCAIHCIDVRNQWLCDSKMKSCVSRDWLTPSTSSFILYFTTCKVHGCPSYHITTTRCFFFLEKLTVISICILGKCVVVIYLYISFVYRNTYPEKTTGIYPKNYDPLAALRLRFVEFWKKSPRNMKCHLNSNKNGWTNILDNDEACDVILILQKLLIEWIYLSG